MKRVGVAGAPGILRTGLEALVRGDPEMQLAYTVESLEDAPATADVVITLDADLEPLQTPGPARVVLIVPSITPEFLRAALRAGAASVLPHDCTSLELRTAVEAAAAGLTAIRTADVEALTQVDTRRTEAAEPGASLSPRETEVLRLLADGLANKEIGFSLGISEHTVKFHVNSILTRLNAASRAEAVAIGIRRGLLLV